MTLTNNEIYTYAQKLIRAFNDQEQKLPVKINFYLQKNKTILTELATDIDKERLSIVSSHGELDSEQQQYIIPPEKFEEVSKELNDLLSLTQEVQIYTIKIDDLDDNLSLTTAQMDAILFMIE